MEEESFFISSTKISTTHICTTQVNQTLSSTRWLMGLIVDFVARLPKSPQLELDQQPKEGFNAHFEEQLRHRVQLEPGKVFKWILRMLLQLLASDRNILPLALWILPHQTIVVSCCGPMSVWPLVFPLGTLVVRRWQSTDTSTFAKCNGHLGRTCAEKGWRCRVAMCHMQVNTACNGQKTFSSRC